MVRRLQPASENARPAKAEAARKEIHALFEKISQQEESLRPSGLGRGRRVWAEIVRYVNADLSSDATAYVSLVKVLYELTAAPEFTEFKRTELGQYNDFLYLSDLGGARKKDLISLAVYYQRPLKGLLLWLCRPKLHPELRLEALRFLEAHSHGEEWKIDYDDDPIAGIGAYDEDRGPFLYFVKEVKFGSIMGPICKFILAYVDDPPKPLPIRSCKRPDCNRLMLPERIGRKEYCSPKCCALDHRVGPKENKDYMWLYRLSKVKSDGMLRRKFKQFPRVLKRLDQIESRWKHEPKFTDKIERIRGRARV